MALYTCHGIEGPGWYGVGRVLPGFDAQGKLEPGDRITQVNGEPLFADSPRTLSERVNESRGAPVSFTIKLLLMVWVYFGLLNLLPIPAFDGGRLMFLAYEIVTGRRIHPKIEPIVYGAGIAALVLVVLIVLYIDIRRTLS